MSRITNKAPPLSARLSKGDIVCIYDTETMSLEDRRVWELCMQFYRVGESDDVAQSILSSLSLFERFRHEALDKNDLKWHASQRGLSVADVEAMILAGTPHQRMLRCVTDALAGARAQLRGAKEKLWLCAFNEPFDRDAMSCTAGSMREWMDSLDVGQVHAILDYRNAVKHVPRLVAHGLKGQTTQQKVYAALFDGAGYEGHQANHDVDALARIVCTTASQIVGRAVGRPLTAYREHALGLERNRSRKRKKCRDDDEPRNTDHRRTSEYVRSGGGTVVTVSVPSP